ncbi:uncharacterized protein Cp110 isoform X1 [Drosophila bipectinata]|uniref:uncharacterized protein Cp110 isoform X1 n=1 Tax=Drosophila bipectinata TaxID=42026 RepID=UPI001C89968C|nr:uncharacterized protein LOC108122856 isoform X1 [Drosophila bipectinata]
MESACKVMEQLLAAVEQSQCQSYCHSSTTASTPTAITTISLECSSGPASRFRLDGQPILPPLMTSSKRREVELDRQMAIQLEEQYRLARCSAGAEERRTSGVMASRRSVPQLQQTETFIYDSTQRPQRPKVLGLEQKQLPTIHVDPPTPHVDPPTPPSPKEPPLSPLRIKPNRITNRILQFELSGLGQLLPSPASTAPPSPPKKCILRSSTSPSLAQQQVPAPVDELRVDIVPTEPVGLQRSRSFTLEEPSQVLVEHMQRAHAQAEPQVHSPRPSQLASYQQETVESMAKKVNKSPRSSCTNTSPSCTRRRERERVDHPERDREIEHMIERALVEQGPVDSSRKAGIRKYLRGHRERLNQLVQYQEEERRRMQAEFDRQQRFLIDALCSEIDESASVGPPESQVSAYTSTGDLERQMASSSLSGDISNRNSTTPGWSSPSNTIILSSCLENSPRNFDDLDEFLNMEDNCRSTAPTSSRKRLFSPKLSLTYDSEPQPLEEISAPSTPRSLPLRNSSLSNTRRRPGPGSVTIPQAPLQTRMRSRTVGNPRKSNGGSSGLVKSPVRVVGGGGGTGKKNLSGSGNSTQTKRNGNVRHMNQSAQSSGIVQGVWSPTKTKKIPSPMRKNNNQEATLGNNFEQEKREWAATRINAAARGFLVRRLFGTEQVQRIVQTIRDTLIFVLNLHLETCGNGQDAKETANLRLKARLLQQLCSASRTLHLIFFQTSIKERMDIISRDRKRIKTKLLAMHVKHR